MQTQNNPTVLLRALKGAPLSVLLALILAHQPVGEKYLIAETGYSQNKVREGLTYLAGHNLVTRTGYRESWVVLDAAYQLPFVLALVANMAPGGAENGANEAEMAKSQNLTLRDPATAASTDIVRSPKEGEEAAAESPKSQQMTLDLSDDEREARELQAANLEALHKAGIGGSMAQKLALLPHMDPDFVRGHFLNWLYEGKSTGILICRLRDGDPLPEDYAASRERNAGRKYLEGYLSQYIEH